jgi:hypothetical protein
MTNRPWSRAVDLVGLSSCNKSNFNDFGDTLTSLKSSVKRQWGVDLESMVMQSARPKFSKIVS